MICLMPLVGSSQENRGERLKQLIRNATPEARADVQPNLESLCLKEELYKRNVSNQVSGINLFRWVLLIGNPFLITKIQG